jgi:CDP-diacylglycerol pyrophosphatase
VHPQEHARARGPPEEDERMGLCIDRRRVWLRALMTALLAALWVAYSTALLPPALAQESAPPLAPDGTPAGHRDRLREITHTQCVPHWLATQDPSPCVSLTLMQPGPELRGLAVLPDKKGGAHLLLIPLEPVSGIESAAAWEAGQPNYFEDAWERRGAVAQLAGRAVPADAIGLAINSKYTRSQDQLHIHMSCINSDVHALLAASASAIGPEWSPLTIRGIRYQAQRVMGRDLGGTNPLTQVAQGVPGARESMEAYTLLVTALSFKEGPGFVLLTARFAPGAELLLDPGCALAR